MKYLVQLFVLLGIIFLPMVVFGQSGVIEKCSFFIGSSTPISASNINEGQFLFGNSQTNGFNRSCVNEQSFIGQTDYALKGWVWNTNLGWISLGSYINEEPLTLNEFPSGVAANAPRTNRFIPSGDVAYSSKVVTQTWLADGTPATGELVGYWWGDNVGWIRLNCDNYYDGETSYCGGVGTHRVVFSRAVDGKYDLSGYAYAESVGFINLAGVRLDLNSVTKKLTDVKVELSIVGASDAPVVANGNDGYKFKLVFKDKDNVNVTTKFYNYMQATNSDADVTNNISFCLLPTDDRYLDSGVLTGPGGKSGTMETCNDSTFNRFGVDLSKFDIGISTSTNYTLAPDGLSLVSNNKFISTVPVSVDGDYVFSNFKISAGSFSVVSPIQVPLTLQYKIPFNVKFLQVGKALTSPECSSGAVGSFRMTLSVPVALNLCGTFSPIKYTSPTAKIRISSVGDSENLDIYFERFREVSGTGFVSVDLGTGTTSSLAQNVSTSSFTGATVVTKPKSSFGDVTGGTTIPKKPPRTGGTTAPPEEEEEPVYEVVRYGDSNPLVLSWRSGTSSVFDSISFRVVADQAEGSTVSVSELQDEVLDLGVKTTLEYRISSTQTIKRDGPSLSQAFFRIDQLSSSGSIDARAFTQLGSGSGSGGASAKTTIRDNFVKQIYDVVSVGTVKTSCVNPSLTTLNVGGNSTAFLLKNCKPNAAESIYYLANQTGNRYLVDYEKIKGFFTLMDSAPKTLVLVGMDVVFTENILNNSTSFPSIVLLTNTQKKGGNAYVTSNITDLKGYVFADKTLFSVEDADAVANDNVSANGVPLNYSNRDFESFYSEIAMIGRFLAQNCIGCSLDDPPKKGDGSIADSIDTAQPYDFNYFRFSSLILETTFNEFGDEVYVDCSGEATEVYRDDPPSKAIDESFLCWKPKAGARNSVFMEAKRSTDASFKTKDRRSVNFIYQSTDVPLFKGL